MKRILWLLFLLLGSLTIQAQSDYHTRQAQAYQREAARYTRQAEQYDREAARYNQQAQRHLRGAERHSRRKDYAQVRTCQQRARRATDQAET